MADIGYHPQIQGGIPGQPDLGGADPVRQAELQEASMQANLRIKEELVLNPGGGGYIPPGLGRSAPGPQWASQPGGPENTPIIGWTAQQSSGPAFIEPYVATGMGEIPDWTSDANSAGAGTYDQTPVVAYGDYNPLNRAPIGDNDGDFFGAMGVPPDPNAPTTDVNGSTDLEW